MSGWLFLLFFGGTVVRLSPVSSSARLQNRWLALSSFPVEIGPLFLPRSSTRFLVLACVRAYTSGVYVCLACIPVYSVRRYLRKSTWMRVPQSACVLNVRFSVCWEQKGGKVEDLDANEDDDEDEEDDDDEDEGKDRNPSTQLPTYPPPPLSHLSRVSLSRRSV